MAILDRRGARREVMALALVGLMAAGCQHHSASGGEGTAESRGSEAERTKQMETKAQELRDRAAEIQANTQMTEQEKIDAVNKLEQERQELEKSGEGPAPGQPGHP